MLFYEEMRIQGDVDTGGQAEISGQLPVGLQVLFYVSYRANASVLVLTVLKAA